MSPAGLPGKSLNPRRVCISQAVPDLRLYEPEGMKMTKNATPLVLDLCQVGAGDVELVGGKCASLGELFRALVPQGVRAIDGFSTTREAYRLLLETDGLGKRLRDLMSGLEYQDLKALNKA